MLSVFNKYMIAVVLEIQPSSTVGVCMRVLALRKLVGLLNVI